MAKKKQGKIRPLALAVIWREDAFLVAQGHDRVKNQTFYRPLGGRIEFGEYGQQTIQRELLEEIQAVVEPGPFLGTLESIFTYESQPGHEIILLFEARFTDPAMYQQEEIEGWEDDELLFRAYWKSLAFFRQGDHPLYPEGLLDLLESQH